MRYLFCYLKSLFTNKNADIGPREKDQFVSVIIPSYNRAPVLVRAIQSVLDQTYQNLEVIVADDASTDNTGEIVGKITDPRVRYFCLGENKGQSAARNVGIAQSTGDFIAFLDSDDEYLPQKIEKSLEIFQKAPARVGMVASNYFLTSLSEEKSAINQKDPKRIFPHMSTWVLRREVVTRVGYFDERLALSEDVDLFQRLRRKFSVHFIQTPLVKVHASQDGFFSDPAKYITLRKGYVEKLKADRRLYALHLKYLAKNLRALNENQEACRCFLKAFLVYPINLGYFFDFLRLYFKKR